MGHDCHCCGDAAYDLACAVCGEPTCEVCTTQMPAAEAEPPTGCVECQSQAWWVMWREMQAEVEGLRRLMEKDLRRVDFDSARQASTGSAAGRRQRRMDAARGCREWAEEAMGETLRAFMDANGW